MPFKKSSEYLLESLRNRLEKHSVRNENGCLIWTKYKNKKGYGKIGMGDNEIIFTHRASWILNSGKSIPKGKFCLHKCDTPSCHEFSHLYIGTASQNTNDMMKKGRHKPVSHNPDGFHTSKLTSDKVSDIKKRIIKRERISDIARDYGVTDHAICDIKILRTWTAIDSHLNEVMKKTQKAERNHRKHP